MRTRLLLLAALAGCMEATGPQADVPPATTNQLRSLTTGSLVGDAGAVLATPVRVKVVDTTEKAVAGVTVSFSVVDGGGSVTPAQVATDMEGIAQASWQLGPQAGANTLKVTLGSQSVTLTATGTSSIGTTIVKVSGGTSDSLPAGCQLTDPLIVKVLDKSNQPIAGATVSFDVAGGDGTTSPSSVTTGADGLASTRFRVGFQGGANLVHAVLHNTDRPSVDFTARSAPAAPNGFSIIGNKIYDPVTCKPLLFHGAARPSLEWWYGGDDQFVNIGSQVAMLKSWGANVLRLSVSQSFWVAGTYWNTQAVTAGVDYKAKVVDAVQKARAAGLNVILDLHASDRGDKNYEAVPDIWKMPDVNNSIPFWQDVAATFKGDGGVIFELYNEPHPREEIWTDGQVDLAAWDVWLNGGVIPESVDYPGDPTTHPAYTAVGMQQLYDIVRAAGARNLVLVNGVHWGYSLNGAQSYMVKGYNVIYGTHPYDWPDKQPDQFDKEFGFFAATAPVMISEFGSYKCDKLAYNKAVMDYADAKGLSWVAWRFWTPPPVSATYTEAQRADEICSTSSLLSDWSGTPSASGALVKARLATYP
jgi:endoglucanase